MRKRLTQTGTVKYLGVLLDDCLLLPKKINHVATKLNQATGILSQLRSKASLKILKMTYHSLFCSQLLHESQLWGQSNITSQNKIQKLCNRAFRKILFQKRKILLLKYTRNSKSLNFPIFCTYKTVF